MSIPLNLVIGAAVAWGVFGAEIEPEKLPGNPEKKINPEPEGCPIANH